MKYIQNSYLPSFIMQQEPRLDSSVRRRARLGKSDVIRKLGRYHMGLTASRFVIENRMSHHMTIITFVLKVALPEDERNSSFSRTTL